MGSAIFLVLALAIYFLPSIIGANRGVKRQGAIFALNLLLGWTLVGWVIALVWALADDTEAPDLQRGIIVDIAPEDALPTPAWTKVNAGDVLKLVRLEPDGSKFSVESEFGPLASLAQLSQLGRKIE